MRGVFALSTCLLALVDAFPRPQSQDQDANDPILLDLSDVKKDDQDKILKPCDDPLVQTVDQDPVKQWKGLGCQALLTQLNSNWTEEKDNSRVSYTEYDN